MLNANVTPVLPSAVINAVYTCFLRSTYSAAENLTSDACVHLILDKFDLHGLTYK